MKTRILTICVLVSTAGLNSIYAAERVEGTLSTSVEDRSESKYNHFHQTYVTNRIGKRTTTKVNLKRLDPSEKETYFTVTCVEDSDLEQRSLGGAKCTLGN